MFVSCSPGPPPAVDCALTLNDQRPAVDHQLPTVEPRVTARCQSMTGYGHALPSLPRAVLQGKKRKVPVTPTEMKVHGDALCFMVKTWARHKTTETVLNNGWRLAVGGWWSLEAVLNKKSLGPEGQPCPFLPPSLRCSLPPSSWGRGRAEGEMHKTRDSGRGGGPGDGEAGGKESGIGSGCRGWGGGGRGGDLAVLVLEREVELVAPQRALHAAGRQIGHAPPRVFDVVPPVPVLVAAALAAGHDLGPLVIAEAVPEGVDRNVPHQRLDVLVAVVEGDAVVGDLRRRPKGVGRRGASPPPRPTPRPLLTQQHIASRMRDTGVDPLWGGVTQGSHNPLPHAFACPPTTCNRPSNRQ